VTTRDEIMKAVRDAHWQAFRASLHWLPTDEKLRRLESWRRGFCRDKAKTSDRNAEVQVENYLNALRRAGLLPPA
jgi:hypothetical protein